MPTYGPIPQDDMAVGVMNGELDTDLLRPERWIPTLIPMIRDTCRPL
jgi:hypothetical protein